jgi:hypothetical protein
MCGERWSGTPPSTDDGQNNLDCHKCGSYAIEQEKLPFRINGNIAGKEFSIEFANNQITAKGLTQFTE